MKAFQKKSSVSSGPVSFRAALKKDLKKNSFAYLLIVPVLLWYLVFCYAPHVGDPAVLQGLQAPFWALQAVNGWG